MTVGQDVRRRRLAKGLSQRGLAILANVSPNRVSDIEKGRVSNLTVDTLERIYRPLDVTFPWDDLETGAKGPYLRFSLAA